MIPFDKGAIVTIDDLRQAVLSFTTGQWRPDRIRLRAPGDWRVCLPYHGTFAMCLDCKAGGVADAKKIADRFEEIAQGLVDLDPAVLGSSVCKLRGEAGQRGPSPSWRAAMMDPGRDAAR